MLTQDFVDRIMRPGRYMDADGLHLKVAANTKCWIARLTYRGKRHDYGLGSARDVSLEDARAILHQCRREIAFGNDPTKVILRILGNARRSY